MNNDKWLEDEVTFPALTIKRKDALEIIYSTDPVSSEEENDENSKDEEDKSIKENKMAKYKIKLLKEEQTVNEVQLQDLYTAASKTEQQIIALTDMAVKFSDNSIKRAAMALKTKTQEFTSILSKIIIGDEAENASIQKKQLDLNNPEDKDVLESVQPSLKEDDMDTDDTSDDQTLEEVYGEYCDKEMNESEFYVFKDKVVRILEGKAKKLKADKKFSSLVENVKKATVENYEVTMNDLYNYADESNIEIL